MTDSGLVGVNSSINSTRNNSTFGITSSTKPPKVISIDGDVSPISQSSNILSSNVTIDTAVNMADLNITKDLGTGFKTTRMKLETVDKLPIAEKPNQSTKNDPPDSELNIVSRPSKSGRALKLELKKQILSLLDELDKAIPD